MQGTCETILGNGTITTRPVLTLRGPKTGLAVSCRINYIFVMYTYPGVRRRNLSPGLALYIYTFLYTLYLTCQHTATYENFNHASFINELS